jgi:hypothetical protein
MHSRVALRRGIRNALEHADDELVLVQQRGHDESDNAADATTRQYQRSVRRSFVSSSSAGMHPHWTMCGPALGPIVGALRSPNS